jgi:alkylresorcinol/alkylpyrone synthase
MSEEARMLDKAGKALARRQSTPPLDVAVLAVATAVPPHVISQEEIARRALLISPQFARLDGLYMNTGIETRHACEASDWYLEPKSWEQRTAAFRRHAVDLLEQAAAGALARAGLGVTEIDALVVNTITGIAVPSLDALLIDRMGFRTDVERLPIFGFGCGGGVAGLTRAARLARAMPGANVLFLTVDLCSLCLRVNDPSVEMFVAAALFGDGAAALVLNADGAPKAGSGAAARLVAGGEHFWPCTERIMGWDVLGDGFGVVLSPELPNLIRTEFRAALDPFLEAHGLAVQDFDGFLLHPGGRKVLETAGKALGRSQHDLRHSWQVLKEFGNMSSATALFVLAEALRSGARGRHLLAAFGPGFSAYFMVLDLSGRAPRH